MEVTVSGTVRVRVCVDLSDDDGCEEHPGAPHCGSRTMTAKHHFVDAAKDAVRDALGRDDGIDVVAIHLQIEEG